MSDDGTHECPHPDCQARVPFEMFACRPHWYQVPKPLRDALWRAWKASDMSTHAQIRKDIVASWEKDAA